LFIVGGLIGLPIGAWLTVHGASSISRVFRRHRDGHRADHRGHRHIAARTGDLGDGGLAQIRAVAIGNVVGSNIFNIGLILGGTAVILPLDVDSRIIITSTCG
jgi:cation:H+ antiporter